jgi:hypothetical protein
LSVKILQSTMGVLKNRIVRLLPDGTLDSSFNTKFWSGCYRRKICCNLDGKNCFRRPVFFFFNGISYNRMVRLNADGSIDSGFSIGTGLTKCVNSTTIAFNN